MTSTLIINNQSIKPGTITTIDLPLPKLYTHTLMTMPIHVISGKKPGPRLFVSAAIHGNELNGVEIVRRLLKQPVLKKLRGDLIAIPMVNVYGVIQQSRYLPDRRDLNRSFPGSKKGSLTARLADLFMTEIVTKCTHGIDLHTGATHRNNLPQIRANLSEPETLRLAKSFNVPVLLNANLQDGSLREAVSGLGIPMLLYEAGEALRFDEHAIRVGLRGIMGVMRALGMLPRKSQGTVASRSLLAHDSQWIRAPGGGIFCAARRLGEHISHQDVLGIIRDPSSDLEIPVIASCNGLIIGRSELPLVHEGEALFHIAQFEQTV
ncbi:MAG: succinylglutamate desuccinylase/aspartoacylase family protein [Nitrosomonas sp.]|nr:succinylglutamate desuccinylase/aspartoacylase family protein [Nitrosomonas sp.]